jgi:hypothetical protein
MRTPHDAIPIPDSQIRRRRSGRRRVAAAAVAALAAVLLAAGVGSAAPAGGFTRLTTIGVGTFPNFAAVRTKDGALHVLHQTTASGSSAPNGLAMRSIGASGAVGAESTALAGWGAGRAGLALLPDGTLLSVFGAVSPGANSVSSIWSIQSSDGGASWSAPADVTSGSLEDLAYGGDVTAQVSGSTPVLTINAAGGIVVQQGLGQGSPTTVITNAADDFAGDVDSTVDAASGEVVASWRSNAGQGGLFVQGVAPSLGAAERAPGQLRNELVIAARDTGPGVYGAYTTDGTHVFLHRYGGGSVPVGKLAGVKADVLGAATGPDGRIWVMWGQDGVGVAVTRSNKAVTKFEPIQHVNPKPATLFRLSGDGRLGPLDLFADETPTAGPAGTFHGRVLPLLSATFSVKAVKNKKGKVIGHVLTVHVSDAGDAVSGAKVAVAGKQAATGAGGIVHLTFPAGVTGAHLATVTALTYQPLKKQVAL